MSQYYDTDKPYSITNWNALVQAINDILENPPEGSTCEPIHDVLSTVVDPHRWSTQDIQNARDKLIETCPNITFAEPLRLWYQPTIDELVSAMDQAWCECDCEERRQVIWEAVGVISDQNYTQEWISLIDLIGGVKVGAANQIYRIQDVDHFKGWTRLMFEDSLNEDGEVLEDVLFPVQQPVIIVPKWVTPGSVYWQNIVDSSGNEDWVGEVTNTYYLELVCEGQSE